jgi:hypothetical protein
LIRVAALALIGILAACSGAGSADPAGPASRLPPDLAGFLRLPVATPSACPSGDNGTTVGRRSPWVGHVDVSVFLDDHAKQRAITRIRAALAGETAVRTIYVESKAEAYAEFQRLYTCSAALTPAQLPASLRLVLHAVTQPQRDDLVRRIYTLPGVATVSCDPSNPCVNVGGSG